MHNEYSIEKWKILSPLCILKQITNQHSCVNLDKLRCSTAINLQINSNQLVLRSSINNMRMTYYVGQRFQGTDSRKCRPSKNCRQEHLDRLPLPLRYATVWR